MRRKGYDGGGSAQYFFSFSRSSEWDVPYLTTGPDDNGGVGRGEGEGWVGAHWSTHSTSIVRETIPDVVDTSSLEVPE